MKTCLCTREGQIHFKRGLAHGFRSAREWVASLLQSIRSEQSPGAITKATSLASTWWGTVWKRLPYGPSGSHAHAHGNEMSNTVFNDIIWRELISWCCKIARTRHQNIQLVTRCSIWQRYSLQECISTILSPISRCPWPVIVIARRRFSGSNAICFCARWTGRFGQRMGVLSPGRQDCSRLFQGACSGVTPASRSKENGLARESRVLSVACRS